jgi:hypothetical protein
MEESRVTLRGQIATSWRLRLLILPIVVLLCVVTAEATARAFWYFRSGISPREPASILRAFYPELRRLDGKDLSHTNEYYDVLFLGASTLHKDWGLMEPMLLEQLAINGQHNVRIVNLATPAHSSRDSLHKYTAAGAARFELVVVYDGFNEIRTNNVPPETFREDYSHNYWYQVVNTMAPYHGTTSFALPYTVAYLSTWLQHRMAPERYLPSRSLRDDWITYGREPRSTGSLEQNLRLILDLAALRGDRVMLMTFASYFPENYTAEAFAAKQLDYLLHLYPIEMWGDPTHVANTIAAHNDAIRRLAMERSDLLFVDQAALMAGAPHYYNDVCHYTAAGAAAFVDNILPVLLSVMRSEP